MFCFFNTLQSKGDQVSAGFTMAQHIPTTPVLFEEIGMQHMNARLASIKLPVGYSQRLLVGNRLEYIIKKFAAFIIRCVFKGNEFAVLRLPQMVHHFTEFVY